VENNHNILIAKGIKKSFGGVQAIRDLDISIQEGKITGLIGSNGSGKTTFFNVVSGLVRIDSGEITFQGSRIDGLPPYMIAQMGIARTFQTMNNFPRLSVFENVRAGIITSFLETTAEENEVWRMLDMLELTPLAKEDIAKVTPVARKLVEVGRALIAKPKLVLFDEIMAGFNEQETVKLIDIIKKFNCAGTTFCIVGHTMRAIMSISDVIIAMHEGTRFAEGTPAVIQQDKDVHRICMGEPKYA